MANRINIYLRMLGRDKRLVGVYTPRKPFEDPECLGSKDGMSSKKRSNLISHFTIGTAYLLYAHFRKEIL